MKVLVFGGGAVGLGVASCLVAAGVETHVVARAETVDAIRAGGLRRTGIFGEIDHPPQRIAAWEDIGNVPPAPFDYVVVCTKSYDTASAAATIASWLPPAAAGARIVLFQNGWGNAEIFRERMEQQVYSARVITGFRRPQPGVVEVTVHAADITVGSLEGDPERGVESLCRAITRGGIPCSTTAQIGRDLWAKMLYNCALNPLGAIVGATYGQLSDDPGTRAVMHDIIREVYAAMGAAGYDTHWATSGEYIERFHADMVPPTAAHESSMLQDIRAGRRTEIDALNGAVVGLADSHAVGVPVNTAVCGLVRFLQDRGHR